MDDNSQNYADAQSNRSNFNKQCYNINFSDGKNKNNNPNQSFRKYKKRNEFDSDSDDDFGNNKENKNKQNQTKVSKKNKNIKAFSGKGLSLGGDSNTQEVNYKDSMVQAAENRRNKFENRGISDPDSQFEYQFKKQKQLQFEKYPQENIYSNSKAMWN
ncbi:hypothetical protein PPERSA_11356 [Pseudocohnilembus persalinus]|uniref:Uncharacterized protein n=1 Tax=Pseudocohnilembus persalinus TaxID=266149 RepID=A0A0V0QQ88_PSEPJ|nr:hypothetical protein PPERSA_11356 [Pseudocohnilembus persalinus]|eukprot:KRX04232.1 hypothetical protein PPERSA_11356 [Pseudocohnilembus persalinus]